MRVTKFEHAALTLTDQGKKLVIDPGSFTLPLADLADVVAVVITHEHPDHWTPDHLDRILEYAPDVPIYGPEGVAAAAAGYHVTVVHPGDTVTVDALHAGSSSAASTTSSTRSIPVVDNVGVLVNGDFYYPGDSYAVPEGADVQAARRARRRAVAQDRRGDGLRARRRSRARRSPRTT